MEVGKTVIADDRTEWRELPEPVKFRWQGRLRGRVQERQWDYAATKEDDEWVVDEDAEPRAKGSYLALTRQKTNVVIQTAEEAQALYATMGHYCAGGGREGITWMNGAMVKSAKRVRSEIVDRLNDLEGVTAEIERNGVTSSLDVEVNDG